MVTIKIKKVEGCEDIPTPTYQTPGSAAVDLHAAVNEPVVVKPGEIKLIPTGIKTEFSLNLVAEITPRSGLALKKGITFPNSPGIIDSDYRDEISVILMNLGKEDFIINRLDRIAQMNFKRIEQVDFEYVDDLSITQRKGGFGSTGK